MFSKRNNGKRTKRNRYYLTALCLTIWAHGALVGLSEAQAWELLELSELSVDYHRYRRGGRDMLLYPEIPKERINTNIHTTVLEFLHWDSTILAQTTDAQYRSIGLETRISLSVSKYIDVFMEHQSLHLIDRDHSYMERFPVTDTVGVKIYLFRNNKQRETLIP